MRALFGSVNKLRRETVDQLQWRERQHHGAVALRLGQPIDNAFGVEQFQPLKCERRASTIAQQRLQAGAILRTGNHARSPDTSPGQNRRQGCRIPDNGGIPLTRRPALAGRSNWLPALAVLR
jgi:hypothetical protein